MPRPPSLPKMAAMGRETKILLGLLGGLSFAFCGALLAKLLIARPPEGAGVDVHADVVWNGPQEIVEPPAPGRPAVSAFSASSSAEPDAAAGPVGRRSYPIDRRAPPSETSMSRRARSIRCTRHSVSILIPSATHCRSRPSTNVPEFPFRAYRDLRAWRNCSGRLR